MHIYLSPYKLSTHIFCLSFFPGWQPPEVMLFSIFSIGNLAQIKFLCNFRGLVKMLIFF